MYYWSNVNDNNDDNNCSTAVGIIDKKNNQNGTSSYNALG